MKIILFALMLQQMPLPPRASLENPAGQAVVPKQLQKDYDKTWARFLSGDGDSQVVRDADKLLKKQKDFTPAMVVQAYADLYMARPDDAERQFEKVLAQESNNRIALFYLAEMAFARDDFRRATELYSRLIAMDRERTDLEPKRQQALSLATEKLVRDAARAEGENRLADAEDLFRQASQLAPQQAVLQDQLGIILLKRQKWGEALAAFRREAELDGSNETIQRHIADALIGLGRTDEARQVLATLGAVTRNDRSDDQVGRRTAELEDLGRWGADIELFHKIQSAEAITREQLATLIVHYFPQLSDAPRSPLVVSDIQDSAVWRDIETVVGLGLLDLMPNRAFEPAETLTRSDFAVAMSRLIRALGLNRPDAPLIPTPDLASSHAAFQDVQLALQCGLLTLDTAGQVDIAGTLSGKQAVDAVEKVLGFLREKPQ
jgi:tetratricopeptide (TPR) repeat protein